MSARRGPVLLVVLDGFGIGDGGPADSTAVAHAPFFARARREFPMAKLDTSGVAVGLPPGQMTWT
jgi:2,3-bisphosphoglycerate-independent phosphoglycerate mutase